MSRQMVGLCLGLALLAGGAFWIFRLRRFVAGSVIVEGTFVGDLEQRGDAPYQPEVEFDCPFTRVRRRVLGMGSSSARTRATPGGPIDVRVSRARPHTAIVWIWTVWSGPFMLTALGAMFAAGALFGS